MTKDDILNSITYDYLTDEEKDRLILLYLTETQNIYENTTRE